MTLAQAIEQVAKSLPEGWALAIQVGHDDVWICLETPDEKTIQFHCNPSVMSDKIKQSVRMALLEEDGESAVE